jgi:phage gp36-like protein
MFLQEEDYNAVTDATTLDVIQQSSEATRQKAEDYAKEEISSYLRNRYDVAAAFEATGESRNAKLVMITADIALYHLIAWLPKKMGFEIRETRYKNAIDWLKDVQAGKASPDLPALTDDSGADIGNPIKYGSLPASKYDW